MGKLPDMRYGPDYRQSRQAQFCGLKHCRACGDGEIYDMENVSLDELPLLKARQPRTQVATQGMDGADSFYVDNGKITVTSGQTLRVISNGMVIPLVNDLSTGRQHRFVRFGDRVVLLPEMRLLNLNYDIKGIRESADELPSTAQEYDAYAVKNIVTLPNYYDIYVYNGTEWINNGRFDQPMEADTGVQPQVTFTEKTITLSTPVGYVTKVAGFKAGDAVTISGCTVEESNNKTAILQEITGDSEYTELRFSDYCFTVPEEETVEEEETEETEESAAEPPASYAENGVRIRRSVPEMDFLFECNNRLWGAKDKRIYASKLGDPTNWNCFEGLSTDSWAIETQTKGRILGGWGDYYPYFLREDGMTTVCGAVPSGFQTYEKRGVPGLADGSERSIAHAGGLTIWQSREGIVVYGSDSWRIEKDVFRDWSPPFPSITGVSAGTKAYYLCWLLNQSAILCFDSSTGLWEKQNAGNRNADGIVADICYDGGVVYALRHARERTDAIGIAGDNGPVAEAEINSFVRFGDRYLNTENKKTSDQLLLRVELEQGATLQVQIMYDSSGEYETVKTISAEDAALKKRQINIPIQPRRCDHYHIRLNGTGGWTLYSMTQNVRVGSEK